MVNTRTVANFVGSSVEVAGGNVLLQLTCWRSACARSQTLMLRWAQRYSAIADEYFVRRTRRRIRTMKPGEGFQASDQAKPHHVNITPPRFARVQDTFVKFSIRVGGRSARFCRPTRLLPAYCINIPAIPRFARAQITFTYISVWGKGRFSGS